MRKNYTLLVFDWDGTLIDSEKLIIDAIQSLALDFECKPPEAQHIRAHLGKNLTKMLKPFFPKAKHQEINAAFYKKFTMEKLANSFFEGAIETLTYLKKIGFTLAIATNRPRKDLDAALALSNTNHLFAATRCPEDGAPKPDPSMLNSLLDELKEHAPENTLMVGDSIFDMQFAKNAKVDALAACFKPHQRKNLAPFKPIALIENIIELKSIFNHVDENFYDQ